VENFSYFSNNRKDYTAVAAEGRLSGFFECAQEWMDMAYIIIKKLAYRPNLCSAVLQYFPPSKKIKPALCWFISYLALTKSPFAAQLLPSVYGVLSKYLGIFTANGFYVAFVYLVLNLLFTTCKVQLRTQKICLVNILCSWHS